MFKPNAIRKTFYSDVLGRKLRLWTTPYTLRIILKRGGFDKYILFTKPKHLDSKMGVHLQYLMKKKLRDPSFNVPYIPLTRSQGKTRKTKFYEARKYPTIYMPAHAKGTHDMSEYMIKTPQ